MDSEMVIARYNGAGGFIMGVPARDLTALDWAELNDAQRQQVLDSSLYQIEVEPAAVPDAPEGA